MKFDQKITNITGNDKYCLILLENGEVYRYSLSDDKLEWLQFLSVENDELHQVPPPRKKMFSNNSAESKKSDEFITDICCGETMSIAVTNKNTLYSIPSKIHQFPSHVKVKKMVCGIEHTLVLTTNGDIFAFGSGMRGQLGIGELINIDRPVLVDALAGIKIVDVAAGGWHSCAVSAFGDLYTWGWNTSGQLGIGPNIGTVHPLPQVIDFDGDDVQIKRVACGIRHTMVISDRGLLFGCGWNRHGQLGLPHVNGDNDDEIIENHFKEVDLSFDLGEYDLICGNWSTVFIPKCIQK